MNWLVYIIGIINKQLEQLNVHGIHHFKHVKINIVMKLHLKMNVHYILHRNLMDHFVIGMLMDIVKYCLIHNLTPAQFLNRNINVNLIISKECSACGVII